MNTAISDVTQVNYILSASQELDFSFFQQILHITVLVKI